MIGYSQPLTAKWGVTFSSPDCEDSKLKKNPGSKNKILLDNLIEKKNNPDWKTMPMFRQQPIILKKKVTEHIAKGMVGANFGIDNTSLLSDISNFFL